jgi:hypothetical protein
LVSAREPVGVSSDFVSSSVQLCVSVCTDFVCESVSCVSSRVCDSDGVGCVKLRVRSSETDSDDVGERVNVFLVWLLEPGRLTVAPSDSVTETSDDGERDGVGSDPLSVISAVPLSETDRDRSFVPVRERVSVGVGGGVSVTVMVVSSLIDSVTDS